jgi:hypothetical protein
MPKRDVAARVTIWRVLASSSGGLERYHMPCAPQNDRRVPKSGHAPIGSRRYSWCGPPRIVLEPDDPVRRRLATTYGARIRGALPLRTQSPGTGQSAPFPRTRGHSPHRRDRVSGTAGRPFEVLSSAGRVIAFPRRSDVRHQSFSDRRPPCRRSSQRSLRTTSLAGAGIGRRSRRPGPSGPSGAGLTASSTRRCST